MLLCSNCEEERQGGGGALLQTNFAWYAQETNVDSHLRLLEKHLLVFVSSEFQKEGVSNELLMACMKKPFGTPYLKAQAELTQTDLNSGMPSNSWGQSHKALDPARHHTTQPLSFSLLLLGLPIP